MILWLYRECWLLPLAVYGDQRAWRRLRALDRLRTRREIRELVATCRFIREMGMDPAPYWRMWWSERLVVIA